MASETRERQRRRKTTLACEPCRERKSRCDGRKPICSTCEHRSLGLEHYTKALHERIRQLERACAMNGVEVDASGQVTQKNQRLQPDQSNSRPNSRLSSPSILSISQLVGSGSDHQSPLQRTASGNPGTVSAAAVNSTSSVAAASSVTSPESMYPENATGVTAMGTILTEDDLDADSTEETFYGRSSAASFLKEAAGSLRNQSSAAGLNRPGPTTFTQGGFLSTGTPLPAAQPMLKLTDVDRFALPPRTLADHFLERFFTHVFYQYPFFDRDAFEEAYKSLWQSSSNLNRSGFDQRPATTPSPANTSNNRGGDMAAGDGGGPASSQLEGVGLGGKECSVGSIVFHCALNSVFALGCCFSDLPTSERAAALDVFANRSKSFVGLDLIDENNLGVVQAMLIISLVLQGTPFPNRCWNAVGMAARVAQGLGLHSDEAIASRRTLRGDERVRQIRRRTWQGCVVMDVLVSMTFGRPPMTSSLSISPETLDTSVGPDGQLDAETFKLMFSKENVKLSVILEGILQRIYRPWLTRDVPDSTTSTSNSSTGSNTFQVHHNLDTVVEIQGQLDHFQQYVTPFLSWTCREEVPESMSAADKHIMEINRNVLQARFIYIQLILYRPILSQLAADSASSPPAPQSILSRDSLRYSFAVECGKSCVEAAKRLILLVHGNYATDKSDVWWWNGLYACAAGLVLIVARSCSAVWKTLDSTETAVLWDKCQSILQDQAVFSAPARKSLNLLLKVSEHVLLKQAASETEQSGSSGGHGVGGPSVVTANSASSRNDINTNNNALTHAGGHQGATQGRYDRSNQIINPVDSNFLGQGRNIERSAGGLAQAIAGDQETTTTATLNAIAALRQQQQQLQGAAAAAGQLDLMTYFDPSAPSLLEDTYTMGPLFTWDQNFDFTFSTP
ncbi:fungal specific transcription factor [Ophiostoma piceae UAMH 11346]|uniref:Fungal specific transcription factor n=1 Tax=Ophiostoma piceae (strain UAMH 11346) TaxID=1262450 RepID=S3CW44_OPHP1|nr:fungal specific transcription factor [Ophiostoma piceae UAMH 11346]